MLESAWAISSCPPSDSFFRAAFLVLEIFLSQTLDFTVPKQRQGKVFVHKLLPDPQLPVICLNENAKAK
jgi:hypothetical protein